MKLYSNIILLVKRQFSSMAEKYRIIKKKELNKESLNDLTREVENEKEKKKKRKFNFSEISKRHIFLKFCYFGWDTSGFVIQENTSNTIEQFMFDALKKCCLIENIETSNYQKCGRTDKGVSAFSQVISLDVRSKLENPNHENAEQEIEYCSMLNRLLPPFIKCYSWAHVGSDVGSRHDCSERTYKYYFPKGNLDINLMREAAKSLLGSHDFRNLCKMDVANGITNFNRNIIYADIKPCSFLLEKQSGYQFYIFEIKSKCFLYHQIRSIMSVLLLVGQKKESPDIINDLLDINKNPAKPQYDLALPMPLNLFEAQFTSISLKWNVNENNITKIIKNFQELWNDFSVKSIMIRDVINDLNKLKGNYGEIDEIQSSQGDYFFYGSVKKNYKPLLTRERCRSLEEKIGSLVKKRKLEKVEEEEEEEKKFVDSNL
ncbi:tRNA pseudouridine synthase, putative [Pediculus humanus corporis]|uniref:tRNA pseudouridine synthase, putative n=1 Tax=Pediculus humanus subsp. corporis TaxID=121224 RepID=E0VFC8_PEDHC|nr:tRNA pseudouridine synthase, putative [Pediculus humanus corporis]EEB12084.1 tRNA pseudouridine synthase, putative [Pediculus humanus corporis]